MTGIYTAALQGGGALGSGSHGSRAVVRELRTALAFWSLVAGGRTRRVDSATMRHREPAPLATPVAAETPALHAAQCAGVASHAVSRSPRFLAYIVMGGCLKYSSTAV